MKTKITITYHPQFKNEDGIWITIESMATLKAARNGNTKF